MAVEFRPNDPIRPKDDVVLRAGAGEVDNLVQRAIDNAADYDELFTAGVVRSRYTISVHVPRGALPTAEDVTADSFYGRYKSYIEAEASNLLELEFVQIVATTIVMPGEEPSNLDLCHYDIVIAAVSREQLLERIAIVKDRFVKRSRGNTGRT